MGIKRKFSIDEIKEITNYNETIDEIRKFLKVEFGKKKVGTTFLKSKRA